MNKNKRVYNIFKNPLRSAESASSAFRLRLIGTRMTRIQRILTDFLALFKFLHLLNTLSAFLLFFKKNKKNSGNLFNFIFYGKNFSVKIFFYFFLCAQIISCKKNQEKELETFSRDQLTIEKGKDVEIIYSDSARIKSRVTGPEMLYYTETFDPRQEFTKGVKTYFYDDQQKEIGVLTGKYAIRNERKRQVIVRDSVVWESVTDGRLETEELIWDEATNTIHSSKFTTITRQNEKIFGFNFETDDKLSHWRILNPKGNIKVDAIDKATQ